MLARSHDLKVHIGETPYGHKSYQVFVNPETKVFWNEGCSAFGLLVASPGGEWQPRSLLWCANPQPACFPAMVALYRYLRRNSLTNHSFRYLAFGHDRYRRGGWQVKPNTHYFDPDDIDAGADYGMSCFEKKLAASLLNDCRETVTETKIHEICRDVMASRADHAEYLLANR